jgi:hypothetical protein
MPRIMSIYLIFVLFYVYEFKVKISAVNWIQNSLTNTDVQGTNDGYEADSNNLNFISTFDEIMLNEGHNNTKKFAAIVLKEGKLYCRSSQKDQFLRARYFVHMLQEGLQSQQGNAIKVSNYNLPIIFKHDDSSGCYPATHTDAYGFPRLSWAVPANNTESQWCNVIGAPSYKTWKSLINEKKHSSWEATFRENQEVYPWRNKIQKAVWRGSTTSNKNMHGHLELNDTPRGRLVQSGINNPFMDVGFHKLVGKYQGVSNESQRLIRKDPIPLAQMMKYRAIIDIDGNNWSARFNHLLCFNSVVIKILPDFVESTFDDLVPGQHYVSASLENITRVVEHVMDENSDEEMQVIISNANSWCAKNMNRNALARSAIKAIEKYRDMLNEYDKHWQEKWLSNIADYANDIVECNIS